ncbi:putative outer membrane protein [Geothrix limicola]|uniref:Outer membrane protein n=1 Tax=Geothrix limicola TaxID=2927978 RepID=A0ABQ5QBV1_9BACT|nr:outer membrane protein transport protein [Geothrix limicola]GLH72295.1 putative outer membrane protein [Geothrix limicola]
MSHRSRLTLTALTLIAAGAFAPQAQASGFQLREQSPSAQGNAFAGISAGGNDISALFFNPAVMTQYQDTQFSLGGTYVGLSAKFENGSASRTSVLPALGFFSAPVTGTNLNTISGPANHGNAAISAVLPEFNIMYSVSNDLKLGLSLNVPFGLTTEYDSNWIGRYHALKSDLKTIDIAPSLAYRVSKEFSFGVAFIARKANAELTNGVDYGTALAVKVGTGLAAAGLSTASPGPGQNSPVANVAMGAPNATFGTPGYAIPGAWDGQAGLKGDGWGYGWKAGFTYEPSQDFRLGLAYQAAMTMTLKGDATFQIPTSIPATDLAALNAAGLRNGKGQADLALPATASLGFDWKATPTFSLQGELARTTWSRFKELRVKFDTGLADSITDESWNDTTFVSVGGTWKLNQEWTLRGGLAFDKSAVDDAHRTPRIPDNDRKWVSLGMSYAFSKKVAIDVGYSHLFISDGKVELNSGTGTNLNALLANDNLTRGNLNGTIKADINILGAQLRYTF